MAELHQKSSGTFSLSVLKPLLARLRSGRGDASRPDRVATCRRTAPNLEVIRHFQFVRFETLHSSHQGRAGVPDEPVCRTPRIVLRQIHDPMPDRIVVHVIQTSQIGRFERDVAVPILKPNLSSSCSIPYVHLLRRCHVQLPQEPPERGRIRRRRGHKMVVIRQHSPSPQLPAKLGGTGKQRFQEEITSLGSAQMMEFLQCTRSDHVNAWLEQPMSWSMWPVHISKSPTHRSWSAQARLRFGRRDASRWRKRRHVAALQIHASSFA
jgi:hypothetical protein